MITIKTTNDSGPSSLRDAIDTQLGVGQILDVVFDPSLSGSIITQFNTQYSL